MKRLAHGKLAYSSPRYYTYGIETNQYMVIKPIKCKESINPPCCSSGPSWSQYEEAAGSPGLFGHRAILLKMLVSPLSLTHLPTSRVGLVLLVMVRRLLHQITWCSQKEKRHRKRNLLPNPSINDEAHYTDDRTGLRQ